MSDQDFFFEEEETDKPAPKGRKGASGSRPAQAGKAASTRKVARPLPESKPPAEAPVGFFDKQVTVAIASLLAIVALLVGLIAGYMLGGNGGTPTAATTTLPATGTTSPPQLTPEQLNSGQLPAGHPAIPATTGTPSPSKAATTGK